MEVLVKFSEILLKGKGTRREMQRILVRNLKTACTKIKLSGGIALCEVDEQGIVKFRRMFGIDSISIVERTGSDFDELAKESLERAKEFKGTFRVRVKRRMEHEFSSVELERKLGAIILEKFPKLKVDLENPENEVRFELRGNCAFFIAKKIQCFGGLPVGASGKAFSILNSKEDFLACWLLLRRGVEVFFIDVLNEEGLDLGEWGASRLDSMLSADEREAGDCLLKNGFYNLIIGKENIRLERTAKNNGLLILNPLEAFNGSQILGFIEKIKKNEPFDFSEILVQNEGI